MVQYYRYDLNRCSRTGFLLATPVTIEVLCSELDPISSSGRNGIPFLSVLSTLKHLNESMVSTHPKNISQMGSFPQFEGAKICKNFKPATKTIIPTWDEMVNVQEPRYKVGPCYQL